MEENMNLKIKFYNNHFTKKIDNKKGMNIYIIRMVRNI